MEKKTLGSFTAFEITLDFTKVFPGRRTPEKALSPSGSTNVYAKLIREMKGLSARTMHTYSMTTGSLAFGLDSGSPGHFPGMTEAE